MSELPTDSSCLFCRIVAGEIPADTIEESEHSLAFRDLAPKAPTHVLVVPKRHVRNAGELAGASAEELQDLVLLGRAAARIDGLDDGYRMVFNTGEAAGQTVFHAHLHVLGGRELTWPPG